VIGILALVPLVSNRSVTCLIARRVGGVGLIAQLDDGAGRPPFHRRVDQLVAEVDDAGACTRIRTDRHIEHSPANRLRLAGVIAGQVVRVSVDQIVGHSYSFRLVRAR
jgi:hypothetical protein